MKIWLKLTDAKKCTDATYPVTSITLNGCALTDYVFEVNGNTKINWLGILEYLEQRISTLAGYTFTVSDTPSPSAPTVTLCTDVKPLRAETGYRIKKEESALTVCFGSFVGALTGISLWMQKYLPTTSQGNVALTLTDSEGEYGKGMACSTLSPDATVRAMTYNVFAMGDRAELISATIVANSPDFVGLQEYFANTTLVSNLKRAGYRQACEKINAASPYSVRTNNVKYENIGITCCTPVFYRAEKWDLIEQIAYLFHWQNRCPHTPTKSVALAVFADKETPTKKILVMNFHAALVLPDYQNHYLRFPEGEHCRPGLDKMHGRRWRMENNKELLREIDEMRAKYPGIAVVLIGDMNGTRDEESIRLFDAHEALTHVLDLAPTAYCDNGPTFHEVGKSKYRHTVPIDHIFISHDTVSVKGCCVARDQAALDSSDHCPVMVDFTF